MTLGEKAKLVKTKEDLVKFIDELHHELKHEPEPWENNTLEWYIGAMSGWIEASDGYFENLGLPIPEQPDWGYIALALSAARHYE